MSSERASKQSPQPLEQLTGENFSNVSFISEKDNRFIAYKMMTDDGVGQIVRLKLQNIHYHHPAEHGSGKPGQYGIPDGQSANKNYSPISSAEQPMIVSGLPYHHKPTYHPTEGDFIEIHYVYGSERGEDVSLNQSADLHSCDVIRQEATTRELSFCVQPLVVITAWAEVKKDPVLLLAEAIAPPLLGNSIEYHGSTTGDIRPTKPAYWVVTRGYGQVSIDQLDLDGNGYGKIKGHSSRLLQEA
jgi:hypothetical protein